MLFQASDVLDARVALQLADAFGVAGQRSGVEHGLRRLFVDLPGQLFDESREGARAQANHQPGVGTKLTAALYDRGRQFAGHGGTARRQRLRQNDDRVDTRHFSKDRNRLGPCSGHVTQRAPALERSGEAYRLNRRVLDQRLPDPGAINHIEHALGHTGALSRTQDGIGHLFSGGHMPAVRLEHHRTASGQRRSGIPARRRKCQREITGAKHGDRPQTDAVLA